MNFVRLRAALVYTTLLFLVALLQPAAQDVYEILKLNLSEVDFKSSILLLAKIFKSLEFWAAAYAIMAAAFIYFRSFSGYLRRFGGHLKRVFLFRPIDASVSAAPLYLTITVPIVPAHFFHQALEIFLL
jgi:hypothetical protein